MRIRFDHAIQLASHLWRFALASFEKLVVPALLFGGFLLLVLAIQRFYTWNTMAQAVPDVEKRIDAENKVLLTLAQILGGGFLVAGLYFTSKTYIVSRQAQVTQRLSAAIESISSEDLSRRVAGIYSLESLLRSSSADYQALLGILSGFTNCHDRAPLRFKA